MWSFSRNPPLSGDNDSLTLPTVNPDQACGSQPFVPRGEPVMDTGRITLRKFSGYPSEDPDQYILDFEALTMTVGRWQHFSSTCRDQHRHGSVV